MTKTAKWNGFMGGSRLGDHTKVPIYVDVAELRRRCPKARTAAKRNTDGDADEDWPIDVGHLTAVALAEVGLDASMMDVLASLYGPAPPPTDAIWESGMRIRATDIDMTDEHKPRVTSSIIIDSVMYAHDLLRSGGPAASVFDSEAVDAAVNKVAGHGFDAHLWSWNKSLREDYKEIRRSRVLVHAIDGHPDLNIHRRNTDA